MMIKLWLEHEVKTGSGNEAPGVGSHVAAVAAMFGLGVEDGPGMAVVSGVELTLRAGEVVFVTGPSGSGKSTILRLIEEGLADRFDASVVRFDQLPALREVAIVDALAERYPGVGLKGVMRALSLAGLNDAFVMLRRPGELSDGQRCRLRVAQGMLEVERVASTQANQKTESGERTRALKCPSLVVVLADEFGATLDRVTAQVVAGNVRKWVSGSVASTQALVGDPGERTGGLKPLCLGVCFVAATTHDDLLEALGPDVLVEKGLGEAVTVVERQNARRPG